MVLPRSHVLTAGPSLGFAVLEGVSLVAQLPETALQTLYLHDAAASGLVLAGQLRVPTECVAWWKPGWVAVLPAAAGRVGGTAPRTLQRNPAMLSAVARALVEQLMTHEA